MYKTFRLLLPPLAAGLLVAGCAGHSTEQRLDALEARAQNDQVLDLRISKVEDRVSRLETRAAGQPAPDLRTDVRRGAPKSDPKTAARERVPSLERAPATSVVTGTTATPPGNTPATPLGVPSPPPSAGPASPAVAASPASPASPTLTVEEGPASGARRSGPRKVSPSTAPTPFPSASSTSGSSPASSTETPRTGKAAYDAALATYNKGQYEKAREMFAAFMAGNPGSLAPNALYWTGECYYSLGRYDTAIITFKDVVAKYPRHDKAADALFKAGLSYATLKDMNNARFYWQILVDDFPKSASAAVARKRLAQG